jgi:hypothetical protein
MMDIDAVVERLREYDNDGDAAWETPGRAADVIEALRKQLVEQQELLKEAYADADDVLRPYVKTLENQLAESEKVCALWENGCKHWQNIALEQQAREMKLRDLLRRLGFHIR